MAYSKVPMNHTAEHKLRVRLEAKLKESEADNEKLKTAFDKMAGFASLDDNSNFQMQMITVCESVNYDLYNEEFRECKGL